MALGVSMSDLNSGAFFWLFFSVCNPVRGGTFVLQLVRNLYALYVGYNETRNLNLSDSPKGSSKTGVLSMVIKGGCAITLFLGVLACMLSAALSACCIFLMSLPSNTMSSA